MKKIFLFIFILSALIFEGKLAMAKQEQILLPKPALKGNVSLEEAISKRRSCRSFVQKPLSNEQIGQLLWAAQGITAKRGGSGLRAAPSAGALYPMEIYLASKDGFFHYLPQNHALDVLNQKDLRSELSGAAWGQGCVRDAAVDIIICAVYSRITVKYGERGRRYVDMEAGHIAQNVHLEAVALGLGSVPIGAFGDEEVKKTLSLPQDQNVLYIIPVGYPNQ